MDREALKRQAMDLLGNEEPVRAKACAAALCESGPDDAQAWVLLAAAQLQLGELESAESASRRALQLNPDDVFAHTGLVRALLQGNKQAQAIEALRGLISIAPNHAEAHSAGE